MPDASIGTSYMEVVPKFKDGSIARVAADAGVGVGAQMADGIRAGLSAKAVVIGNVVTEALKRGVDSAIGIGKEIAGGIYDGFSDFEQLSGGVEKIFDEMDTSKILDDAGEAWRDLNMSTNEYLESINRTGAMFAQTMGDAKAYDTAKTGMQAISDYASGTGRNLQELNEKYAMITRSTSSYQSIADQFSGILPATSADFLKQAQAAGILSDEYQSLTDVPVAEYQQAVTSMLEKGVEELGLMGNTASESLTTLSGSALAAQSAWQNVLTAIGTGDASRVGSAASSLVDALFGAINDKTGAREGGLIANLTGLASRAFEALGAALPGMVDSMLSAMPPEVGEPLRQAFESIGTTIETVAPLVSAAIGGIVTAVGTIAPVVAPLLPIIASALGAVKIVGVITSIVGAVTGFVTTVGSAIAMIGSLPGLIAVVSTALGGPVAIIAAIVGAIVAFVATNEDARNAVMAVWEGIKGAVSAAADAIVTYVPQKFGELVTGAQTTFANLQQTLAATWANIKSTVTNTVGQLVSGIRGKISGIASSVRSTFNSVKDAIMTPINAARDAVQSAISKISSIISGCKLQLPHINLPHFSVTGGKAPFGIGGKGSLPKFSVSWYAKGGWFDQPTVFAGVGERGGEFVWPSYAPYLDRYADALASKMGGAGVNVYLTYNGSGDATELVTQLTRDLRMMRMTGAI